MSFYNYLLAEGRGWLCAGWEAFREHFMPVSPYLTFPEEGVALPQALCDAGIFSALGCEDILFKPYGLEELVAKASGLVLH